MWSSFIRMQVASLSVLERLFLRHPISNSCASYFFQRSSSWSISSYCRCQDVFLLPVPCTISPPTGTRLLARDCSLPVVRLPVPPYRQNSSLAFAFTLANCLSTL